MNNTLYSKTIEDMRSRINAEFVSCKKDYLKGTSKPSYMSQKYLTIIWWQFIKTKLH